jgi:hypothetical protein
MVPVAQFELAEAQVGSAFDRLEATKRRLSR